MANLPLLSITTIHVTIPVESDQQPDVQERMDDAITRFPNRVASQKPHGRYRSGYVLTTSNGDAIHLEAQPTRENYNYLRIGYSPTKIGPEGTEYLVDYLRSILGATYRESFYGGRVQRMVVAFDVDDLVLDDVWIERAWGSEKSIALICQADLGLQSICIGDGSTRRWVFTQAACQSAESVPGVRVEYVYEKGDYTLSNFYTYLDNPLRPLVIRRYAPMPDLMDAVQSRLLFDACRLRGRRQVLAMYPEDERESLKATLMTRFPLLNEWNLKLALWAQLRHEIDALLPIEEMSGL